MTDTISPSESPAAESQDCVDKILAKVDPETAEG